MTIQVILYIIYSYPNESLQDVLKLDENLFHLIKRNVYTKKIVHIISFVVSLFRLLSSN